MILAHGSTDYGLNMATLAQEFTDDYDIIMYDARGHGHSDKPEGPYGVDANAADLVGLIQALGIEKPILMGHSMGASTVAAVGARHPDLPRAVIMEDPGLLRVQSAAAVSPEAAAERAEARATDIRKSKEASKEEFAELSRTERHPDWQHDVDHVRMAEAMSLVSPNIAFSSGTSSAELSSELVNITAPTLILKADADEEQRKVHIAATAKMPNAKIVHIDGASHMIRFDRPEETVREMRAFLAALP
jgi:pimeloyl-ACP methyl ester carboxylesterase